MVNGPGLMTGPNKAIKNKEQDTRTDEVRG